MSNRGVREFRERVLYLIRPHLRVLGNKREGFLFEPRNDEIRHQRLWHFTAQAESRVYRLTNHVDENNVRARGVELHGEAELELYLVARPERTLVEVTAHLLTFVHAHFWTADELRRDDPYAHVGYLDRFHFDLRTPPSSSRAWEELLRRCAGRGRQRIEPRPAMRRALWVANTGNDLIALIESNDRSIYLLHFATS